MRGVGRYFTIRSKCVWMECRFAGWVCVGGGVSLRLVLHHEQCNMIEKCILNILNSLW